jgi:hypothetical protein
VIKRRTGKSKTCVWRRQERFALEGFEGLLRDKTRLSRIAPLGAEVAARVVALTQTDPPAGATHWNATKMAKAAGISASCNASGARTDCNRIASSADPDQIIAAVRRGHRALDSIC